MPTPFYHLSVAGELLEQAHLSDQVRFLLEAQCGDFLFGNTAPDVQVISQQPRQETHFFDLPLRSNALPPWEGLLRAYPRLADVSQLPPSQAAFIAGYLCHLQADWLWVRDIFVPVFGLRSAWGSFPQRLYLHNVLRAYLDREILPSLTNGVCTSLAEARPGAWLPFVLEQHLTQWRDFLVSQIQPQASVQTVEVFAARQGIPPSEFYRLLDSEEAMEREVFARIPRQALAYYRRVLVDENIKLLQDYLAPATMFPKVVHSIGDLSL